MKKIIGTVGMILFCILCFPVNVEAKTMSLNKEYKAEVDCEDNGLDRLFTLNIKETGRYKVTISFDECYTDEYEDEQDYSSKAYFTVISGKKEYDCTAPFEGKKSFIIALNKGKAYIDAAELSDTNYKISTIKVERYSGDKVSFSKAYHFAKKNKTSDMAIDKEKDFIKIYGTGFSDSVSHDRDGYVMACGFRPFIKVVNQGSESYATFNIWGEMLCYSVPSMDDSDLEKIIIFNNKDKVSYDLKNYSETNKYDYVDLYYKDTCKFSTPLFSSYDTSKSDVNRVINIIKTKDSKIKVRDNGNITYYTINLDSQARKHMLNSLRLYKKYLDLYKVK